MQRSLIHAFGSCQSTTYQSVCTVCRVDISSNIALCNSVSNVVNHVMTVPLSQTSDVMTDVPLHMAWIGALCLIKVDSQE